jgi:hypothetical protein
LLEGDCGSSFLVRYVSGDLLFLKPLGTFITMNPAAILVNANVSRAPEIPQHLFGCVFTVLRAAAGEFLVNKTVWNDPVRRRAAISDKYPIFASSPAV